MRWNVVRSASNYLSGEKMGNACSASLSIIANTGLNCSMKISVDSPNLAEGLEQHQWSTPEKFTCFD